MSLRTCFAILMIAFVGRSLQAQRSDSGTVDVRVQEMMGMVDGFLVRSGNRSATTDAGGHARLVLPAGQRTLVISRIGFAPKRVTVVVIADSAISVPVFVAMASGMADMEPVTVTATRTERLVDKTPVRVEVLDEMTVDENTLMAPSNITMLFTDTPGLLVHHTSPELGTSGLRILGLPGQYTAMLADGLPLYGGASSALGPLDISPVDLKRVEIIKGAASSLYGGQALGGVINLVSKPPTGEKVVLLNQRTMGVTDAATWLSQRFSNTAGGSLLVSGTRQNAADPDGDGWGDQPGATRWGVRPRFAWDDSSGRSLFATAGYGYDDRQGGTLANAVTPAGSPFHEGLTGRRADAGLTLRLPQADSAHIAVRVAASSDGRERLFGTGPAERDRISTGFAEVTRVTKTQRSAVVFGAAVQGDAYHNELNPAFDHDWVTPGLFATGDRDVGRFTLSASARGDDHPEAGLRVTERLAVLARANEDWTVRVSGGTGFAPPTSMTEEVEAIGLRAIQPSRLHAEQSLGTMADVNGRVAGAEVLVTGYASSIDHPIQLVDLGDSAHSGALRNSTGSYQVGGIESAAKWRFGASSFLLSYGYARGTQSDAQTGAREPVPLLNRQRVGGNLMLEKPGVYLLGVEATYYGRQGLDDDPYATQSRPYVYAMAIAVRHVGPLELVANFENLLDVRQTNYEPLVRPSPGVGGRWTTDVWAPLEGFMANVAVRYRWLAAK